MARVVNVISVNTCVKRRYAGLRELTRKAMQLHSKGHKDAKITVTVKRHVQLKCTILPLLGVLLLRK